MSQLVFSVLQDPKGVGFSAGEGKGRLGAGMPLQQYRWTRWQEEPIKTTRHWRAQPLGLSLIQIDNQD